MSCRCYMYKQKEQTCGKLNNGFLYGCTTEKCNDGVGCTSYIAPYDTVNTKDPSFETPILWLVIILLVIISTVVTFTEA